MKLIVGLIIFSLLVIFSAYLHDTLLGARIENDLEAKTQAILREKGIEKPSVEVTDHLLDANLAAELSHDTLDELDGVIGIYLPSIENVTPYYPDVDFRVERRDGKIIATGVLPDEESRDSLISVLKTNRDGLEVVDSTSIAENPDPSLWWNGQPAAIVPQFLDSSEGNAYIHFKPETLDASGTFNNEVSYQSVKARFATLPSDVAQDTDLVYNEPVPAPAPPLEPVADPLPEVPAEIVASPVAKALTVPKFFMVEDADQNVTIRGTVDSEQTKQELISATKAAMSSRADVTFIENVTVVEETAPMSSFGDVKDLLTAHIQNANNAELDYTADGLVLRGTVKSEDAKATIIAMAKPATVNEVVVFKERIIVEEPSPEELAQALSNNLEPLPVYFDTSSSTIKSGEEAKIIKAAKIIKESAAKDIVLTVGGYADKRGNAEFNKRLSLKRANAVKARLVELGIDANRLELDHFGEDTTNMAPSDLWKARRVSITLTKN